MKKRFLLIAIIMIASIILTACGPAETEAPEVEEPEVEEPEVEEPEVEEPEVEEPEVEEPEVVEPSATIRIWADEQRAPVLSDLADDFLAEYNVALVVENISGIRDQFSVAAPAGEGPDIIVLAHDQAPALIASGLVTPIDLGAKEADFVQEALDAFTYEGELYGMPYATENLGFFYNTELVEEVPTTWQGVYDISRQLIDEGKVQYGMVLAGTSYDAYPWMTSQGGYIFGLDENGDYDPTDVGVGSEGMIAFGEMAKQWVDDGILSDNTDNTTAKSMFLNGEVAFFMNGPWEINNLREAGTPYGIAAFPDGGAPFMGVQGFLINAFSENILLAQAFLTEFVATEDTMLAFYEADPRVPAYVPALEMMEDPDLQAIAEAGANAQPMPAIPEMGKVWGDWGNALTFIFNGEKTPEEAYTFAADAINAAIASDTTGMINLPGSWQSTVSDCEWDPACADTAMTMGDDGLYYATFTIPAGDYEVKVAHDGGWDTNYGVDGVAGGDNITFSLAEETEVTFVYDPETHLLEIVTE
jgi:maltose/maltodextrin transport system substrate-binding protein/arabinogalactan oligomer/maltooligosaccharide transport system substrate-binding protein